MEWDSNPQPPDEDDWTDQPEPERRILAAALFAFLLGFFVYASFNNTIPRILRSVQAIEPEVAEQQYSDSLFWQIAVTAAGSTLTGFLGGFLARGAFVTTALLANAPFIGFMAWTLVFLLTEGDVSMFWGVSGQFYAFLGLVVFVGGAAVGGILASLSYAPDLDLDLAQSKATFFGISWPHYFWITPLIVYPYLATVIMVLYAAVLALLVDFYFMFHPSVWFDFSWWIYAPVAQSLVVPAVVIFAKGVVSFLELMQRGQTQTCGARRLWKGFLYGVLFPCFSFALARVSTAITHNLPKP